MFAGLFNYKSDQTGGGGGSGSAISDTVATFADLPSAASHTDELYAVTTASGVIFVNRKAAGVYRSDGADWIYVATLAEHDAASEINNDSAVTGSTVKDALETLNTNKAAGAASSTDNAIARFDSTTGKIIQNSGVTIDDSNNVLTAGKITSGASDSMTINGVAVTSNLSTNSNTLAVIEMDTASATAGSGPAIYGARARGTIASKTVVQSGDTLSTYAAVGFDGTDYALGGRIDFIVDNTPGNNDMPTKMVVALSADGSHTPTTALTIASTGAATFASTVAASNLSGTNTGDQDLSNVKKRTIGFSTTSATTGQQGSYVVFPVAGTITGWKIVANTGTATVKVWKIASGTTAPTISNVINTSGVSLSTGTAIISSTTSDFTTTAVSANDIFAFDLTAVSGTNKVLFELEITVT
jgi:hypothetical protein